MKPVALAERAIRNSSKSRDIVLDPFGGSGTTLIAAERTGRRAQLIELDPKYVDVIVERWQESTGGEARLAYTSLSFGHHDTAQHRMRRNGDENSRGVHRPIDQSQEWLPALSAGPEVRNIKARGPPEGGPVVHLGSHLVGSKLDFGQNLNGLAIDQG